MRRARRGSMGRRSRVFSYVLVAVIAFSLGGASRASAETGGLTQLVTQVQALATGLAAEILRATTADADNAKADALYQQANDHRMAAAEQAQKAPELWNPRHDPTAAADRPRHPAPQLNDPT